MSLVLYAYENHLAFVTLNRPDVLNCFNYETLVELERIVEQIRLNEKVRVVVFTGAGEKAFSVGADLKERNQLTIEEVKRNLNKIGDVFSKIDDLPQPTIAALNGFAFGGGMELALACDFRILVEGTMLGLTETSLGIIPGAGGTQRLTRLIGQSKALELVLTAKKLSSTQALHYGIVNRVVKKADLIKIVQELADEIMINAPVAVQQAKIAIKNGSKTDLQTGLQIERKAYEVTMSTEDRLEALRAFNEKRKPNFQGR